MKLTITTFSFILGLGVIFFFPSHHGTKSGISKIPDGDVREQNCGCEAASGKEDFPYANHMDPQKYMEIYHTIQEMPSEDQVEGTKRKGLRSTNVSTAQWQSFGPLGVTGKNDPNTNQTFGRIRCMQWYYNAPMGQWELYLGASSGGLWYGVPAFDGTIYFVSLGDKLANPSVGAFAIDPFNRDVFVIGSGDWNRYSGSGIFKTTDRGQNWTPRPVNPEPGAVTHIIYLVGNSVMIMSTNVGVFRSTDGGDTWTHMKVEPADSNAPCFGLVAANAATIYAGLSSRGIYKSINGGFNWTKMACGGPNGLPCTAGSTISVDVAKSDPSIVFAAFTDTTNNQGGIYKSTDAGGTWFGGNGQPTYMNNGQGSHVNVIKIHPQDADRVYAGAVSMLITPAGGAGWVELNRTYHGHDDITDLAYYPPDPSKLYICSDGGITVQDSATLMPDNTKFHFLPGAPLQVYEMDHAWSSSNIMLAGTQDNGLIRTDGASVPGGWWQEIGSCDGASEISIDPTNASFSYVNQWCSPKDLRLRSFDGGESYQAINSGMDSGAYRAIRYSKGGDPVLWTISQGTLYYSLNKGDAWSTSTMSLEKNAPGGLPGAPRLTVNNWATNGQKLSFMNFISSLKIADGAPGSMNVTTSSMQFDFVVPDRWNCDWVYGLKPGYIFRSTNRGQTWEDISGGFVYGASRLPYDIIPYDIVASQATSDILYLATNLGMFKTLDAGVGWFSYQDGLPIVAVIKIAYVPGTDYDTLRIGTYGRGFWQRLINDVTPHSGPELVNMDIFAMASGTVQGYGVGMNGKGIKSTDGGNSWHSMEMGTPSDLDAVEILTDHSVLAAGDLGMAVRSTDSGGTWTLLPVPTAAKITGISSASDGTSWMCAEDGSILKSVNGIDWSLDRTIPNTILREIDHGQGGDGGVLGTTTSGSGAEFVDITTDGGGSWNPSILPTSNRMRKLRFLEDSTVYVVGDSGTIIRSPNLGGSWTILASGTKKNLFDCFFVDQMTGWVCGDSGTFLKTEDGGTTWSNLSVGASTNFHAITISVQNLLAGGDGAIFVTNQQHQNTIYYNLSGRWNLVSLPVMVSDSTVPTLFPTRTSNAFAYAAAGGYTASSSLSPGRGYWLKFNGDQVVKTSGKPISPFSIPVVEGWNLIGSASIFVQTQDIQSSPPGIVTSQFYDYNGSYTVANTLQPGKAYWVKASQAGSLVLTSSSNRPLAAAKIRIVPTSELPPSPPAGEGANRELGIPREYALQQNYPNPFNPSTRISYSVPIHSNVQLKVYDLLGREVATLVNEQRDAGNYAVEFDASRLASGIYFCRLNAGKFVNEKKMLLLK